MYKLLIVDDEPEVVEWLYDLFQEKSYLDLDIYKAYSADKALDWLAKTKMDIVLSDIRMPGMNGIQMMENIKKFWPECKIIFFTGYNEFDYVYDAIHYEGVNFILKTEDDDFVVQAVEKATHEIESRLKDIHLIDKAKKQISLAAPILQRDYLQELLHGNISHDEINQDRFNELKINLSAEQPVLLIVGRMDQMPPDLSSTLKSQYFYSLKIIMEKYFSSSYMWAYIVFDHSNLTWLFQPKILAEGTGNVDATAINWDNMQVYIKGMLELVQTACRESIRVTFSFAIGSTPERFSSIQDKYIILKQLIDYWSGCDKEIIITENTYIGVENKQDIDMNANIKKSYQNLRNTDVLATYLSRGQKKEFFIALGSIIDCLRKIQNKKYNPAIEIYLSISVIFLSIINKMNLTEKIAFKINLSKLTNVDEHNTWDEAVEYLYNFADIIFMIQEKEQVKRANTVIEQIQTFINNHMNEDLSLSRLSDISYFNQYYLSRLFKQTTGINISDYISDIRIKNAKCLLESGKMKINEVAASVGYESAHHFTRFFKKATGITPQEYRQMTINKLSNGTNVKNTPFF